MEEQTVIPRSYTLPPVQDYEYLRSEGLKHIEELSSEIWTDYNPHDPGITTMEALCYAITELGYRCGFDMRDLLRSKGDELVPGQPLFTARDILTINPLTITDYRKLLADLNGVRNAWLVAKDRSIDAAGVSHPVNELPIYADCDADKLIPAGIQKEGDKPLFLSGLYTVLLDLEYDERLGDLNNGTIIVSNAAIAPFPAGAFVFEIMMRPWKEADFNFARAAMTAANIQAVEVKKSEVPHITTWELHVTARVTISGTTEDRTEVYAISVPTQPASQRVDIDYAKATFNDTDNGKARLTEIFTLYLSKITKARDIVRKAVRSLNAHRNLCEDFVKVTTADTEEIAFCFDVDAAPAADIEKIEAEIFYAIENYLNPPIAFYSLKELLDKKIAVDDIFTGPVLEHGFIDTEQIEQTVLRTVIHTSDIINLLMDIDGVQAIRNFVMTKYDANGSAVSGYIGRKWCMEITDEHKPILSTARSKVLLYKNSIPFLARYSEVEDTILMLHAIRSRAKLNGTSRDIPVPTGSKRDTESYWPLQYDFPQVYGIGQYGLPAHASEQRIAQQRQLKGYLMFYEQLLADFLSQLTHAHELFSYSDIRQTYYAQYLKDIKDIDPVYGTSDAYGTLQEVINGRPPVPAVWPDATTDAKTGWQSLYEDRAVYEDRRGRFLDHLLARFAESFNDYAMLMYNINYDIRTEEKISFAEISSAKMATIRNYPMISSERGKAYNYLPEIVPAGPEPAVDSTQLWDTGNVSGLEKRISFLTGMPDLQAGTPAYYRRFLSCMKKMEIECEEEIVDGKAVCKHFFTFVYFDINPNPGILTEYRLASERYDDKDAAQTALEAILPLLVNTDTYDFLGDYFIIKIPFGETHLQSEKQYPELSPDDRTALIGRAIAACKRACEPLGLHLLEHILLRPRRDGFKLMEVCLHDCDCLCELDPYTFRASVVLPAWPGHFDNMSFRKYFEDKIREEAPAHIMLKICWLSNELMQAFEVCYKNWVEKLATYALYKDQELNMNAEWLAATEGFEKANNLMIDVLASLHSEYPLARLHDCLEKNETSSVVVLGKTVLGTYKSK